MKRKRNVQSLSKFKRDTGKIVRNQKHLDAQDKMEAIEGIKRGLESMKRNSGKPAEKFFREFFAEKGF